MDGGLLQMVIPADWEFADDVDAPLADTRCNRPRAITLTLLFPVCHRQDSEGPNRISGRRR